MMRPCPGSFRRGTAAVTAVPLDLARAFSPQVAVVGLRAARPSCTVTMPTRSSTSSYS